MITHAANLENTCSSNNILTPNTFRFIFGDNDNVKFPPYGFEKRISINKLLI